MSKKAFLILLFIQIIFNLEGRVNTPVAVKGVIDLRQIEYSSKYKIKLNGEWEFYWRRMLHPHDFVNNIIPDYYGPVPSYWTDYPQDKIKTVKEGYATYRLIVLLPNGFREALGIDLPVFKSSYDLYINGRYYGGDGIPGKTTEETTPEYRRNFFKIDVQTDTLEVIINVANFSHSRSGFWRPVTLGSFNEVRKTLSNRWAGEWVIFSLLLLFSLFYLFFFIMYPREKIMGFFSIATFGLALRPLFTSFFLINDVFEAGWIWIIRFEYLSNYIIIIGSIWFVNELYPRKSFKGFALITTLFFSIVFILTFFLPAKIFTYTTYILYPVMLISMVYVLFMSFIGILKKNRIDIVYFLVFILLLYGGVHDIRVSLGKAESEFGYSLSYFVVLFVFMQAVLLIYKWVKSFNEMDKLRNDLEYLNRNLELIVNQRTMELKTRNDEIEKQNSRIALQNRQLSETINLKNKIFSVIAHDLRSPVVNILYMLNLLKEKEYKEKYDTFANSSIEYAQRVISLLENMLVWGRGQEDKIKYSPERRNLADIVLTNLSIFKETADKKEIFVNFTQVGSSMAYFDKDLMDIIIRNLLSNAVKYTPRGGRISILLKDKSTEEGGILLKICDNGIGISEAKQKYLFTATEIASTPGTENERGTGLGLKLCNELVLINEGTITVESREGEGSCFSILLPDTVL